MATNQQCGVEHVVRNRHNVCTREIGHTGPHVDMAGIVTISWPTDPMDDAAYPYPPTMATPVEDARRIRDDAVAAERAKWERAVAYVRSAYPEDVFPNESDSIDAKAGTMARIVCDSVLHARLLEEPDAD